MRRPSQRMNNNLRRPSVAGVAYQRLNSKTRKGLNARTNSLGGPPGGEYRRMDTRVKIALDNKGTEVFGNGSPMFNFEFQLSKEEVEGLREAFDMITEGDGRTSVQ